MRQDDRRWAEEEVDASGEDFRGRFRAASERHVHGLQTRAKLEPFGAHMGGAPNADRRERQCPGLDFARRNEIADGLKALRRRDDQHVR